MEASISDFHGLRSAVFDFLLSLGQIAQSRKSSKAWPSRAFCASVGVGKESQCSGFGPSRLSTPADTRIEKGSSFFRGRVFA
ncbi:MAG: hypothetical protein ACJAT3_000633 [Akkermansiaceae bacterium]|jgi:hypothetical protein